MKQYLWCVFLFLFALWGTAAKAQTEAEVNEAVQAFQKAVELYQQGDSKKAWETVQPHEKIWRLITKAGIENNKGDVLSIANVFKLLGEENQAQEVTSYYQSFIDEVLSTTEYEKLRKQAAALYKEGKIKESIIMAESVLAAAEREFGKSHTKYIDMLASLARLCQETKDYTKAEQFFLQTLELRRTVQGEQHSHYVISLNELIELYTSTGNYAKAEPLCVQVLNIRRNKLGNKHPNYAAALNNLALCYDEMGNYAKAELLYLEAFNIQKNALGEHNPSYETFCLLKTNLLHIFVCINAIKSRVKWQVFSTT